MVRARVPAAARRRHYQPELQGGGSRTPLCRAGRRRYPGSRSGARERAGRAPGSAFGRSEPQRGGRAGHLAGLSPKVVPAEPGILVLDFIEGRTFTPEDVRNPANLDRMIDM